MKGRTRDAAVQSPTAILTMTTMFPNRDPVFLPTLEEIVFRDVHQ